MSTAITTLLGLLAAFVVASDGPAPPDPAPPVVSDLDAADFRTDLAGVLADLKGRENFLLFASIEPSERAISTRMLNRDGRFDSAWSLGDYSLQAVGWCGFTHGLFGNASTPPDLLEPVYAEHPGELVSIRGTWKQPGLSIEPVEARAIGRVVTLEIGAGPLLASLEADGARIPLTVTITNPTDSAWKSVAVGAFYPNIGLYGHLRSGDGAYGGARLERLAPGEQQHVVLDLRFGPDSRLQWPADFQVFVMCAGDAPVLWSERTRLVDALSAAEAARFADESLVHGVDDLFEQVLSRCTATKLIELHGRPGASEYRRAIVKTLWRDPSDEVAAFLTRIMIDGSQREARLAATGLALQGRESGLAWLLDRLRETPVEPKIGGGTSADDLLSYIEFVCGRRSEMAYFTQSEEGARADRDRWLAWWGDERHHPRFDARERKWR